MLPPDEDDVVLSKPLCCCCIPPLLSAMDLNPIPRFSHSSSATAATDCDRGANIVAVVAIGAHLL